MRFKFFYVLILLIIVILVGVYVFETVKIDALSINKDINEEKVEGRSYIKLKYLGKSKYDKKNNVYIEDYNLEKNSEFTWYAKCYGENVLENLDKGYGTNFVNTIEIDNEYWTNELYDFNANGNIRYKEENMPYE